LFLCPFFLHDAGCSGRLSAAQHKENDTKVTRQFLLWCSSFF
jgi:hypothetical protein